MLRIQTANLTQEQQRLVHPDFLADEQAYLHMRSTLLAQYRGQWVAVQGGKVISSGASLMAVMDKASTGGGHPYIALVGTEDAVVFRVRRAVFGYGSSRCRSVTDRAPKCPSSARNICMQSVNAEISKGVPNAKQASWCPQKWSGES